MRMMRSTGLRSGRHALAVVCLSSLILTVAAESILKDGTSLRMSNEQVEEKLQVRPSVLSGFTFAHLCYQAMGAGADAEAGMLFRPISEHRQAPKCFRNSFFYCKVVRGTLPVCLTCDQCSTRHSLHLWTSQLPSRSMSTKHRPIFSDYHGRICCWWPLGRHIVPFAARDIPWRRSP